MKNLNSESRIQIREYVEERFNQGQQTPRILIAELQRNGASFKIGWVTGKVKEMVDALYA